MIILRNHRGTFLVGALLILLYSQLPLGTALEFGEDEGFELMKGFLCSKGYSLYKEIWSDHPPLYTLLLKWAFQAAGPSILVARLIAAGFGLLLFLVFFRLVSCRSNQSSAAFATFFLIASPVTLLLSVSVMKEVATFGTALLSVWLLFRWSKQHHWAWLVASGVVMGLASEIKFAALLVVPAALVEIVLTRQAIQTDKRGQATWIHLLIWVTSVLAVLTIIGLGWSRGSFEISWKAHLTGHAVPGMLNREEVRFPMSLLRDHAECVFPAAVGVWLIVRKRRWREVTFPIVLLLTVVAVHAVHRPWWDYYYLHLAIPLAWLAGLTTAEVVKFISGLLSKSRFRLAQAATWKGIAMCALTALALTRSLGRLEAGAKDLREREKIDANPVIAKMKEYADRTNWAFADNPIFPFHARLLVPPELAVVTPKRFWSKQIAVGDIVAICRRRRVQQVLLDSARIEQEWKDWLQGGYSVAYQDGNYVLYLAKAK